MLHIDAHRFTGSIGRAPEDHCRTIGESRDLNLFLEETLLRQAHFFTEDTVLIKNAISYFLNSTHAALPGEKGLTVGQNRRAGSFLIVFTDFVDAELSAHRLERSIQALSRNAQTFKVRHIIFPDQETALTAQS